MPNDMPSDRDRELSVLMEFYKAAREDYKYGMRTNSEILKLHITLSVTLITVSIAAADHGVTLVTLICCVSPNLSLLFSLWRNENAEIISNEGGFLRVEFNHYIYENLPNLRGNTLKVLNQEEAGIVKADHSSYVKSGFEGAFVLHYPGVLSLIVAYIIYASVGEKGPSFRVGIFSAPMLLVCLIISTMVLCIAIYISVRRNKYVIAEVSKHRKMVADQRKEDFYK